MAGRKYKRAAEAGGLPPGTTSHDLRHHYASVLLDAGESVHAVAARIGDTPAMVLEVYGHLMPDQEDRTRRAVDAAWQADGTAVQQG
jgi:integrase